MKRNDFYQKHGHPSHWRCLKGIESELEREVGQLQKPRNNHDKLIDTIQIRLIKTDRMLKYDRFYIKEHEYSINDHEHEADLICLMDNRAYAFEIKSSYKHRKKAIEQLRADKQYIQEIYEINNIHTFYVVGSPSNYELEEIILH